MTIEAEAEITRRLAAVGVVGVNERPVFEALSGGVSSEIWRVRTKAGMVCVKRALSRLKVAAVWEAPVERNHAEAEWMRVVGTVCPGVSPKLIAEDAQAHLIVMEYFDPASHFLWKHQLSQGNVDLATAQAVGTALGTIHAATAARADIPGRFANDASFHALRLEPYLEATARSHPLLAPRLMELSRITANTRRALVHGDVSPKNILVGPNGPIFLDAECAWFGDPAFDAAFVLNHLLLKCLWVPASTGAFLDAFSTLADAYLATASWEDPGLLERRIAALLPGLFLARVDGKSPVEYVWDETDKERVRRVASALLLKPVGRLQDILDCWVEELNS